MKVCGSGAMLRIAHSALFLGALLLTGCGGGPTLGEVEGTVTLDGAPLPHAKVEFQPAAGAPSVGETDAAGKYKLMYSPDNDGALPGTHTVRITTYRANPEPGSTEVTPERVPTIYNSETTLTKTVEKGDQTIDFTLTTPAE